MRSIDGSVVRNEDQFLNQSLYVLYGNGAMVGSESRFLVHSRDNIPNLPVQRINVAVDTATVRQYSGVSDKKDTIGIKDTF